MSSVRSLHSYRAMFVWSASRSPNGEPTSMGLAQRITRRALLRLSGRLMIGTTVSTLFLTPHTAHAEPDARTFTWEQRDISLADSPVASPTLTCDFAFNALEARWDADL